MIKRKRTYEKDYTEILKKQKVELDNDDIYDDSDIEDYEEKDYENSIEDDTDIEDENTQINISYNEDEKISVKNILMEEIKKIKETVYNPDIKIIDNNISKIKKTINGNEYEIPYDIYVKYIISSPVNFTINKRMYNISHLYDNYTIQNIYKTIQSKENIDTISNCGTYKILFNTDTNIANLNKYGENPKSLRFDKNDSLYSINETVLVKSFLPDLYNCKLNTMIFNIGMYNNKDKIGHRNILVLRKNEFGNNIICEAYIYEPQGEKLKEIGIIEKFIKELNEKAKLYNEQIKKNMSFHIYHPHPESCPIGIQELLSKKDTGLCMVYSYLWCNLFILTCLNDEFMNNNYDISLLVNILEKDIINSAIHKKDLKISLYKLFVRFGYYSVEGFKKYISKHYNIDENLDKIIPEIEKYKVTV